MKYEILGIGSAVIDEIVPASSEFVNALPGGKGGCLSVEMAVADALVEQCGGDSTRITGGSCANTMKGLAHLGRKCALIGVIGKDAAAEEFLGMLERMGISSLYERSDTPTARTISLVTPDGERTMRTFVGACAEMHEELLHPAMFEGVKLVHLEGYSLFQNNTTERAMALAHEAGALISIDLSSYEIVRQYHSRLLGLIQRYADIVIANADEAWELTGRPPKEACSFLKDLCPTAVVLFGEGGCWVGQGSLLIHGPAFPANPVDTTGAGDLFASGFLDSYLSGLPLDLCARKGTLIGSASVEYYGSEMPSERWQLLLESSL